MRIAGLEKTSLVDYPGHVAAVLFTPGCNLDCGYCHNRQLLAPGEQDPAYDPQRVLEFLVPRAEAGFLDGVVVTGGEPTLQKDLPEFLGLLRELNLKVKLDTNGTQPWIVRDVIERGLVDFVAMDVKAPAAKYDLIAGRAVKLDTIDESIDLLRQGQVDYEFRTTFDPRLTTADILRIARRIYGAKAYAIQQYRPVGHGVDMFGRVIEGLEPHSTETVRRAANLAAVLVEKCLVRGLPAAGELDVSMPAETKAWAPPAEAMA